MAMQTYRDPLLAGPYRMMDEFLRNWGADRTTGYAPPLDVRETDDEYLVLVDLPGLSADEVTIELSGHLLSIAGSRARVDAGEAQLSERPFGSFVRTLTLPQGVAEETITANFTDGVLEVHVPKPVEQQPRKITIGVNAQKAINT
jgi:HSP20 family protein